MIQLGHLYEHLYCGYLEQFFRSHNVHPYLDYKLIGRTYYGGIIYIECILYTEKAIKLLDHIAMIDPDFSEDSVYTHFSQIIAEHHRPFGGLGIGKITAALKEIHSQAWQHIDSYMYTDYKALRTQSGPVYIAEGKEWSPKKIYTNMTFATNNGSGDRKLLPLFRQVALFINATLQSSLPFEFGYFSHDDAFKTKPQQAVFSNTFYVDKDQDIYLDEISTTIIENIRDLLNKDTILRFLNEFQTISYKDKPFVAPDIGSTYEDTLLIVGSIGWKDLASIENITDVLDHTSVDVRFGNKVHRVSDSLSIN